MKRILCFCLALGLMAVMGCQQSKPVDAARNIVNKQIAGHKGFDLDTSKLTYKVVEKSRDLAKVSVAGAIQVKGELLLKKTGGKWVLADMAAAGGKAAAADKMVAVEKEKAAEKVVAVEKAKDAEKTKAAEHK